MWNLNLKVLRPAISTQVFLVFLCLQANAEMVPKFQVATARFSCSPPNFKLIKITPRCGCRRFNCFLNYRKKSEIQNSAVCLKPPPITITSSLSHYSYQKGRAGVAWEPSNKIMRFLPPQKIKRLSFNPLISSLNLLFDFKGLNLFIFYFMHWTFARCGSSSLTYPSLPWAT
jgi:hypothetical protein